MIFRILSVSRLVLRPNVTVLVLISRLWHRVVLYSLIAYWLSMVGWC